jgi:hypothetical protein
VATSPDGSVVFVTTNGSDLAYEATSGRVRWRSENGTSGASGAQDIVVSPSGEAVVSVGERTFPDPRHVVSGEIVVTAHDPGTGRSLWQFRYRDPDGATVTANRLTIGGTRVFVAGQRLQSGQILLFGLDLKTGSQLWLATYDGPDAGPVGASVARPVDVVGSADGQRVYLTGMSREGEGPYLQWVTSGYDGATGRALWTQRFAGDGESAVQANEIALHPDGGLLYVTGWAKHSGLPNASFDFQTIAYDTTNGRPVWSGGFAGPGSVDDLAFSVTVSPNGRQIYVSGYSGGLTPRYWVESREARTGTPMWQASLPLVTPSQQHAGLFGFAKVRPSPDGRQVYVAAAAEDGTSFTERMVAIAVDAFDADSGSMLWHGSYSDRETVEAMDLEDFAVDPSGERVYVTGQAWDVGRGSVQTAAFVVRSQRGGSSLD